MHACMLLRGEGQSACKGEALDQARTGESKREREREKREKKDCLPAMRRDAVVQEVDEAAMSRRDE